MQRGFHSSIEEANPNTQLKGTFDLRDQWVTMNIAKAILGFSLENLRFSLILVFVNRTRS